jgi:hypothetical protein
MRSYRQMKDVGKAHYGEANAEACEPRSAEHAVAGRPAESGRFCHMVAGSSRSRSIWSFPTAGG